MPFGLSSFDQVRRLAAAARGGDATAAATIKAGAGLHVHRSAQIALGAAATITALRVVPGAVPVLKGETDVTRGLVPTGGSSGRSATPQIPTGAADVLIRLGREIFGGGSSLSPCPSGSQRVGNRCVDLMPGGDVSGGGVLLSEGEVVKGRYGAAEMPEYSNVRTARCRKGLVLGDDGLCYRSRDLRKDERKWNPGRKPLLTGGELNAIRRAASAANKMRAHQSQLQRLGLLPRPKSRRQIELELRYGGKLRGR